MAEKLVETKEFEKFLKWLEEAPEKVIPFLGKAVTRSLRSIQENISPYPPSTAANQPGRVHTVTLKRKAGDVQVQRPMGYYERGRGWWYPVLRGKSLGDSLGVAYGAETAENAAFRNNVDQVPQLAGYKLADGGTSEMLGRSWAIMVTASVEDKAVVGELGNNSSYSLFVQGPKDKQASHMQQIGWTNADDAVEKSQPAIDEAFGIALADFLATMSE